MIGFVTKVGHHGKLLGLHLVGNLLQHTVTGDLVWEVRNHDFAAFPNPAGAHPQGSAAGFIHLPDVLPGSNDFRLGRKIRAFDVFTKLFHRRPGLIQQAYTGGGHFPHVVRRDIGGHTNRNTGGAIQKYMGQPGRQYRRLFHGAIKIGHPVHRTLPKLAQEHFRERRQAGFGVTHGGKGFRVVRRAPVPLPVHQRVTVRKRLGHQHHGFVTRAVTMGVKFTQHVAHGARGLLVFRGGFQSQLGHGIDNSPLNRFQAIADIGKCPVKNDVHGIIEIGLLRVIPERNPLEAFIRSLKLWHGCLFNCLCCLI